MPQGRVGVMNNLYFQRITYKWVVMSVGSSSMWERTPTPIVTIKYNYDTLGASTWFPQEYLS